MMFSKSGAKAPHSKTWRILAAAFACLNAFAFSPYVVDGRPARWDFNYGNYEPEIFNNATKSIRFYLGSDTYTTQNRTAELNAMRACFAQWQAISGTVLKFEEAGLATTGVDINVNDGRNIVFWAKSNRVNGGMDDISTLPGYTVIYLDAENRIHEADIALNAVTFSWNIDFNNTTTPARFVEGVLLHEIGHFLGLDHTPLGGATVIDGGPGLGPMAGLSSDEIAAARFLYPASGTLSQFGNISGTVRMNGAGILGAMVTAETSGGLAISATTSDAAGNYNLAALPPGAYNVRVSPLDPNHLDLNNSLFRGIDVTPGFGTPVTAFKPTEHIAATVNAGTTTPVNFSVTAGEPPLRIQQISKPVSTSIAAAPVRYAVSVNPRQTVYTGVIGASIPADATFTISGDGITMGLMVYEPNRFAGGQNLLQTLVTVASNATPGLRSYVVRRGNDVAYANGYFEVSNPTPDFNFDALDDRFQRQYFPLFTAPEAGPAADPDNDRFSNAFEAMTGSNPVNSQSYNLRVERVDILRGQARVTWKSDIGKQYQVYGKADVAGATWQTVGAPITATETTTAVADVANSGVYKFYKIKLLP